MRQHEPILLDRSSRFALRSDPPPSSRRLPIPRSLRPGAVDGAGWPRTGDLAAELSDLEALLGRWAGSIDELVAAHTRYSLDRTQNEAALRRWDNEGGHPAPMDPADRRASFAPSLALTGGPT